MVVNGSGSGKGYTSSARTRIEYDIYHIQFNHNSYDTVGE